MDNFTFGPLGLLEKELHGNEIGDVGSEEHFLEANSHCYEGKRQNEDENDVPDFTWKTPIEIFVYLDSM